MVILMDIFIGHALIAHMSCSTILFSLIPVVFVMDFFIIYVLGFGLRGRIGVGVNICSMIIIYKGIVGI